MNLFREEVSPDALDRYIRGRLIVAHGIDCDCIRHRVPILSRPADDEGCNWAIDEDALVPGCAGAIRDAGHEAATRLNLKLDS